MWGRRTTAGTRRVTTDAGLGARRPLRARRPSSSWNAMRPARVFGALAQELLGDALPRMRKRAPQGPVGEHPQRRKNLRPALYLVESDQPAEGLEGEEGSANRARSLYDSRSKYSTSEPHPRATWRARGGLCRSAVARATPRPDSRRAVGGRWRRGSSGESWNYCRSNATADALKNHSLPMKLQVS